MEQLGNLGLIVLGATLLYYGADFLVKGASTLARLLGVPAVVVGLTVVSYGTSLPEFAVTVVSALKDATDIALGNVIGSNISNVGLILGTAALVSPLSVDRSLLKREIPLVLGVSMVTVLMTLDGAIGHVDGLILATVGFGYTVHCVLTSKSRSGVKDDEPRPEGVSKLKQGLFIALGMAFLGAGAQSFVTGAAGIARWLGVGERVIGLSLVALGTSLPELAASIVATLKGEDDISLGNVVGSNFFNLVFVLGVAAAIHPIVSKLDVASAVDMGIMIVFTAVLIPLAMGKAVVGRIKGGLLLGGYVGYIAYLFLIRSGL